MLFQRTRHFDTHEYPVLSSVTSLVEGSGLVQVTESSIGKVSNGTGADAEKFVGVAFSMMDTPATLKAVEENLVVPTTSPYTITLQRTPVGGATSVRVINQTGSTINIPTQAGAAGAQNQVQLSGANLVFNATDAATPTTVNVYYSYTPTVGDIQQWVGDGIPGTTPVAFLQTVGVIRRGEVHTDQFDASADWTAQNIANIKVGTSGVFQRGGTGASVTGYVLKAPTADVPFLGLFIQ